MNSLYLSNDSMPSLDTNVRHLNRYQANTLVAHLTYKKYHYNVKGILFKPMHDLFEMLAEEAYDKIDEIAERALIIGGQAINEPEDYIRLATLEPRRGPMSLIEMLEQSYQISQHLIKELLEFEQISSELGDVGTSDLFIRHVQTWEKQAWFLRETLSSINSPENANPLSGRSD